MTSAVGATPVLQVKLLGGFQVERSDLARAVSDWQRRSAKTLTKLLATCPGHALHREQILDRLWPDADVESALNSLGKALHAARHAFEPELPPRKDSSFLRTRDAMLVLDTDSVVIDADRFEQSAQDALRLHDLTAYESALAAYGGELLPEDRYEDWCTERRDFLAELRVRLLLGLAEALEVRGACNESADRLRDVLRLDPAREVVHRRLMRLYAEMGTPDQAVRQFHHCEEVLRRELGMAPQPETVSLYQDVLASRIPYRHTVADRDRHRASLARLRIPEPARGRPFIGRERLVQHLCKQLTRGDEGRTGLILVSGEAGVGKTRLLAELADEALRQGAVVLSGGRGAPARQFACGPFAVALEAYVASRPEAERSELAQRYPPLARFVPSLGMSRRVSGLAAEPGDYQLDLIPAIVRLLSQLASRQPVLILMDDLHLADHISLDMIRYLAQLAAQRRWLLVGAVREEELAAATELGRMAEAAMRERLCLKIELGCLGRSQCDQLVQAMLPGVSDTFARQIYYWSRGNPLFVEELVREGVGAVQMAPGANRCPESSRLTTRVPARVRALAATRVAGEDETLRRVLWLAAAARPEISLSKLRRGAAALNPPVREAALFDALDRALQMGLLEERARGYAFRYPLVRSALYEDLARHRRDQIQAALA